MTTPKVEFERLSNGSSSREKKQSLDSRQLMSEITCHILCTLLKDSKTREDIEARQRYEDFQE